MAAGMMKQKESGSIETSTLLIIWGSLIDAVSSHVAVDLGNHALKSLARSTLCEVGSTCCYHSLYLISPFDGGCELGNEVLLDFFRVGVCLSINVLIDRTLRSGECCILDGCLKFVLGWLHEWRVECATYREWKCALCACCLECLACLGYRLIVTRDDKLAWVVVVGANNDVAWLGDGSANLFNLGVVKTDDGCHCGWSGLTSLLHRHSTFGHERETILERERASGYESGEFTERVTAYHVGSKGIAHADGRDDRVKEHGWLSDFGLLQFFRSTFEHDFGDVEAENLICLVKEFLRFWISFIEVFAHSWELSTLTRENKCFHVLCSCNDWTGLVFWKTEPLYQ